MPELAEVEYGRRIAENAALGRRITTVWCDDDPIVFDAVTPEEVRHALDGAQVTGVKRRGKQLWMTLDRRPWPLFHFGMTGAFRSPDQDPLQLASSPKRGDGEWPPRFPKIRLHFDDGGELVMTNKRRLGRIRLRQDPEREAPISRLGFDPLNELPGADAFRRALTRRRSPLKAVLLNQSFSAGVGNWLADDICYAARIDPRRRASELTPAEVEAVRRAMKSIVEKAVSVDADAARFPDGWLFHQRWGKPDGVKTLAGDPIEFIEVAGRTTAWVPSQQR
jgi:formamidopyrimidine-DNA glycosylase